eukprot:CAMPEP_0176480874 /NCGR_PEP_ID=MMETSP0200_2-20121128/2513_1 /TAXON_ID=947934 /ORGANISM="Chaetoceros sp., Strain GSL56" /LENGTH=659 /DNA_ID=CAMNT_0017877029 /DNA_START=241 /DNA_END=2220 /DNA_ORIENTATION=-
MDTYWHQVSTQIGHVDGIGLWNSFTRNFSSPLLAAFDLLDNSFDAAPMENGHIHINPDKSFSDDDNDVKGFFIVNNCENKIKDLSEVLTVFKSTKGGAADAIGENGVGVKQGCATLSDRSFILCRNKYEYSLGVVALELQKETGIYLPSFKFIWDPQHHGSLDGHIDYELRKICRENTDVAAVVEKYGDDDLSRGILALLNHFLHISSGLWDLQSTDHVFSLVICELKHGNVLDYDESDDENSDYDMQVAKKTRKKVKAERRTKRGFLSQILEGLPRHYLHVGHSFDVQVDGRVVSFSYWQRRLVEMTHFKLLISKKEIKENEDVDESDRLESYEQDQYMLDVYFGFDAIRCADPESKKRATLVYHSRRAGRLIKEHQDARGELSLSAGGTTYCQGLTIIVDDKHGHFPLNPTKTDFAFGEQSYGATHQENLKAWIGAATKIYYNHHLDRCGKSKAMLTKLLTGLKSKVERLQKELMLKAIDECTLTTFEDIDWKFSYKTSAVVVRSKDYQVITGEDTLIPLQGCKSHQSIKASNAAKKVNTTPAKTTSKVAAKRGRSKTTTETSSKKSKNVKSEQDNTHAKNDTLYYERELLKLQKERDNLYEENEKLRAKLEDNRLGIDAESEESEVKRLRQQLDFFMRRADRLAEENDKLMSIMEK